MADKTMRTKLELTGEDSYKEKLTKIKAALSGVASEERVLNATFDASDKSMAALASRHELLDRKLEIQTKRLETVRKQYENVSEAMGEDSEEAQKLRTEYNNVLASTQKLEKQVGALEKEMTADAGKTKTMRDALKELGVTSTSVGSAMEKMGKRMTAAASALVSATAGVSIKAFMDFEDHMAIVSTIADTTEVSMEELSEQMLEASSATGVAAGELADATYQAISAGRATKDAVAFTELAAKTAKAGLTDTSTVVNGVTSAMNAWKISAEETESVMDKLLLTQNLGKTSVGELAGSIGQLTGLAPQLNMSLDEVLAATAALTKNGVATSTAMNGLKAVMSSVMKPTSEAQKEAARLGIEFDAAALKAEGFTGFLEKVMKATNGDAESLAKLFGSVEGLSQIMLLGGGAAEDYAQILEAMGNSAGTLDKAFSDRTSSRAEKLNAALNRLKNNAIQFGQSLAPLVDAASGVLEKISEKLSGMSAEQQQSLLKMALMVAGLGTLTTAAGKLIGSLSGIKKGLGALSGVLSLGKLGAIVAAAAGITAGVIALKKHLDSLRGENKLKAAFSNVQINTQAIDEAISAAEEIEHSMTVNVQMKAALASGSTDLAAWTMEWLTDGKVETQAQKDQFKAQADALVQPVFDAIQSSYDEKKAALDQALAAGLISDEDYKATLAQYKADLDGMTGSLNTEKEAFVAYALELAAAGVKPTEEQLTKLQELADKITAVGQQIIEETNNAQLAAKASATLVAAGKGTAQDVAIGMAYYGSVRDTETAAAESVRTTKKATLQTKYEAAEKAGAAEEELAAITAEMVAAEEEYEAQIAQIEQSYTESINAMFDGIAQAFPEQAQKLRDMAQKQHVIEEIIGAIGFAEDTDLDELEGEARERAVALIDELMTDAWAQAFGSIDGDNPLPMMDGHVMAGKAALFLSEYVDAAKKDMSKTIEKGGFDDILTQIVTAMAGVSPENLDVSAIGENLGAALTTIDLTDDGKTAGEELSAGWVKGLDAGKEAMIQASIGVASAANEAYRQAQGIRSPSTVWREFGENMDAGLAMGIRAGQGEAMNAVNLLGSGLSAAAENTVSAMIAGINRRRGDLVAAYRGMALEASAAVRNALQIHSPSRVFESLGDYTAQGLIAGVNRRMDDVQAAYTRLVTPRNTGASAAEVPSGARALSGRAGTTIVNQINYTAGAGSRREARMLSQRLAQEQKASLAAEGL